MVNLKRRRLGVSNILAAMMLVVLAIAAAGVGVMYMNKQTEMMTKITSIEADESRLYVNPLTGDGDLTLVFINTGTTTVTLRQGKIGLQGSANITFSTPAPTITYSGHPSQVSAESWTVSDPKLSGLTAEGLVLASQTSATIKFTDLPAFATAILPNKTYPVTVYTTTAETFTFTLVAETSGS
jgi:hypothetical protein